MLKKASVLVLLILMLFFLGGCDQFYFKDYEASGVVKDSSGAGIESANINFSDGSSVKTLSDGSWKQTGLNGDVEITPKKDSYTFNPSVYQLSQLDENKGNINFTANSNGTDSGDDSGGDDGSDENNDDSDGNNSDNDSDGTEEETYTASGIVTSNSGELIPEVELIFSDGSDSVKTGTNGAWEKTGLSGDVTVTPEIEGWQFEPANKTLNVDNTIVDFTASPAEDYSHYSLSGMIYNNDNLNLVITFEKDDGTVINRTVTDKDGSWKVNHVWGKVNIKPQTKETVIGYEPDVHPALVEDNNIKFTAIISDKSYTASGTVLDGEDNPLENVTIRFNDGEFSSVKTNAAGEWTKEGLLNQVNVTALKTGYSFNPESLSVATDDENVDFTAIDLEKAYRVSGTVLDREDNPIEDVTIRFNNGEFSSVSTAADGSWESGELTGEVNVSPMKTGYTFSPDSLPVSTDDEFVDFIAIKPYSARGIITNNAGERIPGVELQFSDNTSVYTSSTGKWEKTGLVGEVTVTPQLDDWQFDPANKTLTELENTANFTARPAEHFDYYTLSGVIYNNYNAHIRIEIRRKIDNVLIAEATTDADGNWSAANIWSTVTVTPIKEGNITGFDPVSQTHSGEYSTVDFTAEYQ